MDATVTTWAGIDIPVMPSTTPWPCNGAERDPSSPSGWCPVSHYAVISDSYTPEPVPVIGAHDVDAQFYRLHLLVPNDGVTFTINGQSYLYRVVRIGDFQQGWYQPQDGRTTVMLRTCDDAGPKGEANFDGRWELWVELAPAS